MNKQEFVKQIEEIQNLDNKCREIAKLVNELFCAGSTPSVVDFHYNVTESHVENIAKLSGIDKCCIEEFLWSELDKGVEFYVDGNKVYLADASELWDYHKEE